MSEDTPESPRKPEKEAGPPPGGGAFPGAQGRAEAVPPGPEPGGTGSGSGSGGAGAGSPDRKGTDQDLGKRLASLREEIRTRTEVLEDHEDRILHGRKKAIQDAREELLAELQRVLKGSPREQKHPPAGLRQDLLQQAGGLFQEIQSRFHAAAPPPATEAAGSDGNGSEEDAEGSFEGPEPSSEDASRPASPSQENGTDEGGADASREAPRGEGASRDDPVVAWDEDSCTEWKQRIQVQAEELAKAEDRALKDIGEASLFAGQPLMESLIPVLDVFHMARDQIRSAAGDPEGKIHPLRQGVEMVFRKLRGTLEESGLPRRPEEGSGREAPAGEAGSSASGAGPCLGEIVAGRREGRIRKLEDRTREAKARCESIGSMAGAEALGMLVRKVEAFSRSMEDALDPGADGKATGPSEQGASAAEPPNGPDPDSGRDRGEDGEGSPGEAGRSGRPAGGDGRAVPS